MTTQTLDWNEYIETARAVAAEGTVLIENNGVLPFSKGTKLAVFGRIQANYYKSGTGSGGMVAVDHVITIPEALKQTGTVELNAELESIYTAWLKEHPELMQPESRYNEMYNNFLKPGLKDLCVSRATVKWGIPVTFDESQTVYVWVDALPNYISALGYNSENDSLYQKYWPADLHLVGKEIFRFHTIIWPALLKALNLPLPEHIYSHGWLLVGGRKLSKSTLSNDDIEITDPLILIKRYGADALRAYLALNGNI